MELSTAETSGTEAARVLGLPRQMVNYHVLALEKAGFLVRVGDVRRRNMVERRFRSTSRSYVISPDILGSLSGTRRRAASDAAGGLLSLATRIQGEAGSALRGSPELSAATSFTSTLHFRDSGSRDAFTRSLGEAVVRLVNDHGGPPAPGTARFRLVFALYPCPARRHPHKDLQNDDDRR